MSGLRGGTMFSGIGAPECAALWVDWRWCAEIDPFPAAVHATRFPHVPNLGDVLAEDFLDRARAFGPLDLLVAGPPCQAFSIAGLRRSLDDARGNLTLRWVQVIHAIDPRWAVTENVPGWLSTKDNAFGCFLAGLVGADAPLVPPRECGRRWTDAGVVVGPVRDAAWRILDAQYFGVAQRRRRVFVVSRRAGNGECAEALLPLTKSLSGHPPPRRETREDVARPLAAGSRSNGGYRNDVDTAENLIAPTLNAAFGSKLGLDNQHIDNGAGLFVADTVRTHPRPGSNSVGAIAYRISPNDGAWETGERTDALTTGTDPSGHVVAFAQNQLGEVRSGNVVNTLNTNSSASGRNMPMINAESVRRLTPTECERLQGFPTGWTDVLYRGRPAADGPRYKAIGNSMAVPVLAWILERIRMVDALELPARAAA